MIWVPKKCLNLGVQNNHSSFLFLKTLEMIQTFVKETYRPYSPALNGQTIR